MNAVTALIPCYNAAAYLPNAIASVRAQTRPVDEIIVIDDCSTDGSAELATSLGVRVVSTDRNSGPSRSRNLGIEAARGDIVAFLDADDWWEPDHIEIVVGLLERFPEADVAFARVRRVGDWRGESAIFIPENQALDVFWTCVHDNIVPQMGVAVRRATRQSIGGYDETMRHAEDYDLWLRCARRHRFVCSHRLTANYRGHGQQASVNRLRLIRGAYDARHRMWQELARSEPPVADRMAADIRGTWKRLLTEAWFSRDRAYLEGALGFAALVPGSAPIERRWRWRTRLLWPVWRPALAVWDRVPAQTQHVLKRPALALLGIKRGPGRSNGRGSD